MTTFIVVLFLIGLIMVMLSITILLKKNGKFPDTHIEDNKHLKKMGISCASNDEYGCGCSTPQTKSACELCAVSSCSIQEL